MKKLMFAASLLALTAFGAVDASAQFAGPRGPRWEGGHGAPPQGSWHFARSHDYCLEKARRLHDFEARAGRRGFDRRDERIVAELRADLRQSCGGGRWHPDRGWYH